MPDRQTGAACLGRIRPALLAPAFQALEALPR
jgi:hypothetical protein